MSAAANDALRSALRRRPDTDGAPNWRASFLTVDEAKAQLGIPRDARLEPTLVTCAACGEDRRAAAGDDTCLWCRVGERHGAPVHPCKPVGL